jgi:hypothetical protein
MAADLPQPWHAAPRARPLTVHDFKDFCAQQEIRITNEIYLAGARKLNLARSGHNLRATTAIFELA